MFLSGKVYSVQNKKRSRRRPVFRRRRSGVSPTVHLCKLDARSDATPMRSSLLPTTFLILNMYILYERINEKKQIKILNSIDLVMKMENSYNLFNTII